MLNHSSASNVTEHLTSISCNVIEETEYNEIQLLDLGLGALCQHEKKENPNGYNMMKAAIASCENLFQCFWSDSFTSELANDERLAEAVLPAYTVDLTMEDPSLRIKAVKLLAANATVKHIRYINGYDGYTALRQKAPEMQAEVREGREWRELAEFGTRSIDRAQSEGIDFN
eukprot:749908-Hanusia_phi.AAC.6